MKTSLPTIARTLYLGIYTLLDRLRALHRKKRSEYALAHLEDHLLDDVGLCRLGDKIVPTAQAEYRYHNCKSPLKMY